MQVTLCNTCIASLLYDICSMGHSMPYTKCSTGVHTCFVHQVTITCTGKCCCDLPSPVLRGSVESPRCLLSLGSPRCLPSLGSPLGPTPCCLWASPWCLGPRANLPLPLASRECGLGSWCLGSAPRSPLGPSPPVYLGSPPRPSTVLATSLPRRSSRRSILMSGLGWKVPRRSRQQHHRRLWRWRGGGGGGRGGVGGGGGGGGGGTPAR